VTTAPSTAIQAARESYAARLKSIRLVAGMTGRDLARECGWHSSKVSRIEHTATIPTRADVRAWVGACRAVAQLDDLLAALEAVEGLYVEWRLLEQTGMRRQQESYAPLYAKTKVFRVYEPGVVPGLLQTEAYARARLGCIAEFSQTPADTDAAVAARLERQAVIKGAARFVFVIEEAALHARIGGTETQVQQLGHLVKVATRPNVSLGVIPLDVERVMWWSAGFWIFDDERVLVEIPSAELTIVQPCEVDVYARTFARLQSMALTGAKAMELIVAHIGRLSSERNALPP
jgi:transcriptional regulator with XRE-family HTH domain